MSGPRGISGHHLVKSPEVAILYLSQFPQPAVTSGIALRESRLEKNMQTRSTAEEYAEQLRIMARRYLQEAERLDEVKRLSQGKLPGAEP